MVMKDSYGVKAQLRRDVLTNAKKGEGRLKREQVYLELD